MKLPCKVIEDMLPMYYDKVCSEESAALVEEHLKGCPRCGQILLDLRANMEMLEKKVDDSKPLRKIQKSYKKMRRRWLITILCLLALVPIAFLVGNDNSGPIVEFTKEEAVACGNAFMTSLTEADYAKAFSYWDIEEERYQLLSGNRFAEEDLVNLEWDGLKKFCEGGEKLELLGGIESFEFVGISGPGYVNRYGTESYEISYRVRFDGKDESFGVSVTKNGIDHISAGDSLIKHPLSHLTLWVQWVVDDYLGQYYDFDSGRWVHYDKDSGQ